MVTSADVALNSLQLKHDVEVGFAILHRVRAESKQGTSARVRLFSTVMLAIVIL